MTSCTRRFLQFHAEMRISDFTRVANSHKIEFTHTPSVMAAHPKNTSLGVLDVFFLNCTILKVCRKNYSPIFLCGNVIFICSDFDDEISFQGRADREAPVSYVYNWHRVAEDWIHRRYRYTFYVVVK